MALASIMRFLSSMARMMGHTLQCLHATFYSNCGYHVGSESESYGF